MAKVTKRKPYEFTTPEAPVLQEYIDPKLFGGFGADDAGKVLRVNANGEWCCSEDGKIAYSQMPEGYPYIDPKGGTEALYDWSGTTAAASNGDIRADYVTWADALPDGLTIGETYVVTFNGVDYECVCFAYNDSTSRPSLGNASLPGSVGNGEPFLITKLSKYLVLYTAEAGEHSYTIKKYVPVTVPMAEEFLPESVKGDSNAALIFRVDYSYDTYEWTMVGTTYEEFRAARLNSKPICGMTNGAPGKGGTLFAVTKIEGNEDEDGNTWVIITNSNNEEFRYNPDGTIYPNGEY